jgi:Protein of unknown function (DUF3307)
LQKENEMFGFSLILGHLFGDYILQNDWQAKNKSLPTQEGRLACLTHCLFYTLGCFIFCGWFLPLWSFLVIGLAHYPFDRYRLAYLWMTKISGQKNFASSEFPFFP